MTSEHASFSQLQDAEGAVLESMTRLGLGQMRMLDLGVGAGRTTLHFAPRTREYVGIDISPNMIDACRVRFSHHDWDHVSFAVCDVRDMRVFPDEHFNFVLFSWNGLDFLYGQDDRLRALAEIRRVCKPGATFCFSSENLNSLSVHRSFQPAIAASVSGSSPSRVPLRLARRLFRPAVWRLLNPSPSKLSGSEFAMLISARHGWRGLRAYHIRPSAQLGQLRQLGFQNAMALSPSGEEIPETALADVNAQWLYYVCTKPLSACTHAASN